MSRPFADEMIEDEPVIDMRDWLSVHSRDRNPVAGLVLTCMADVTMRPIEWLWQDRVAIGKVTVLAGDGGLGKTTVLIDIAGRTTRGDEWPDGVGCAPRGAVVMLTSEDDAEDTIKPRLAAVGADMTKVFVLTMVREQDGTQRAFTLQADLEQLEASLKSIGDVKLVIIDPVTAYLGKGIDSHKNAEVRGILGPLGDVASRCRVAVICNTHFSKAAGGNANQKIIGSVAFVDHARMALQVWEDPEDKDRRLFVPSKSNISRLREGLAFRIEQVGVGQRQEIIATRVAWELAPVSMSADEIMAATGGAGDESKSLKAEAIEFLEDELAAGPVAASEILKRATAAGHTPKALRMARKALGIRPAKSSFDGGWIWTLPKMPSTPEDAYVKEVGAFDD